jgi:hypothetical protein
MIPQLCRLRCRWRAETDLGHYGNCPVWGPTSTSASFAKCFAHVQGFAHVHDGEMRSAKVRSRPVGTARFYAKAALAGPALAGLWRFLPCARLCGPQHFLLSGLCARASCGPQHFLLVFRLCAQVSSGPEHLLLIGFPIFRKQFHLLPEPVLIFLEYIGGRLGIANTLGRFERRVHALMTSVKPTLRKFLQAVERFFLVLPELDAHRRIGLQSSCWLQDIRK